MKIQYEAGSKSFADKARFLSKNRYLLLDALAASNEWMQEMIQLQNGDMTETTYRKIWKI